MFSYRKANHLADALVQHSFLVKDKLCFFQVCSGHCKHLLDADEKRITTPRSVYVVFFSQTLALFVIKKTNLMFHSN
jgi:predicted nucleic acid-binding Zn ribbon protein